MILPEYSSIKELKMLKTVDFPAPFGPKSPNTLEGGT